MRLEINVVDTGIPIGVAGIIADLPVAADFSESDAQVVLRFNDAYIYCTGLVLLATWRKTLPGHVQVKIDDSGCREEGRRLLTNTGFRDLVETNSETPSIVRYRPGKVPIQPIVQGYSTEQAIGNICRILETSAGHLDLKAFRTLLSELCENVFAHSKFETPGYISAHLHSDRCEIAIADSGIGIRNSYLEGSNEDAKVRISHGASSIGMAMDGLVSSKPARLPGALNTHYGYGLRIVRGLIERNAGRLTIASDNELVNVERYQRNQSHLKRTWTGTFIGLLIDLNNPLSLEDVYDAVEKEVIPTTTTAEPKPPAPKAPVAEKEFVVASYGTQLLTRELGISIRADLATLLSGGGRVRVVLDGIEDITPSVADECFGKLAESMGRERYSEAVILSGGHSLVRRLLELVVNNRLTNT